MDFTPFCFMPGRGTTEVIFALQQLQEKEASKKTKTENAFNNVLRSVLWWVMRTLSVEEWVLSIRAVIY